MFSFIDRGGVDPSRIFVGGMSNGGQMALRIGCELADRIRAVLVISAALSHEPCQPARPVSVLGLHGDEDTLVPLGGNGVYDSAEYWIRAWARKVGCTGPLSGREADVIAASGCPTDVSVELRVVPGGHDWPYFHLGEWADPMMEFIASYG